MLGSFGKLNPGMLVTMKSMCVFNLVWSISVRDSRFVEKKLCWGIFLFLREINPIEKDIG